MDLTTVYVFEEIKGLELLTDAPLTCGYASDACFVCDMCEKNVLVKVRANHTVSSSWKVTTPPTCTENGIKTGYCSECNQDDCTASIPALGHKYTYTYDADNGVIIADCTCDTADYTLEEVTVDEKKSTAPTCSTEGKTVYVGKDTDGKEISVSVSIAKLPHTMPSEHNENGAYLYEEGVTILVAGEALSEGETAAAIYVCPDCDHKILITVYLPTAEDENG